MQQGTLVASPALLVILVISSQLLLGEWQKVERDVHPCDFATLGELSCILAANVPTQNHEVGFIAYLIPQQESTSEFSRTKLVHYQLVQLFLLNGSLLDLAEMSVFLKCYIKFFTNVTEEIIPSSKPSVLFFLC